LAFRRRGYCLQKEKLRRKQGAGRQKILFTRNMARKRGAECPRGWVAKRRVIRKSNPDSSQERNKKIRTPANMNISAIKRKTKRAD